MQAITQFKQELATERGVAFKRDAIGWIIVILNVLIALGSTYFFLGVLKTSIVGWLVMNACVLSVGLFMIGFLLTNPIVMVAGCVLMFRHGTLGLFMFGWSGSNIMPQIGHILMTLAIVYVLVHIVHHKKWRTLIVGLVLGIAILIPFTLAQKAWFDAHPGMLEMLFGGDWDLSGQ